MTRSVCLADVAEVVRGVTYERDSVLEVPHDGFVPILRAGNIQDELALEEDLVWADRSLVADRQMLQVNDIVMCTSSGSADVVGKSALFEKEAWQGSFGAFCAVIRADAEKCVPAFLSHVLRSAAFLRWARASLGANIKNIRKSELERFQFPLPEYREQQRIANILDKAEGVRRKRKSAVHLLDEFLGAAFYELCGDPVMNSRLLPEKEIAEIGTVTTGNTPSREVDANFGDEIEWVKSDNINTPKHVVTEAREGLSKLGASIGRIVPAGSVLMTCIAGSHSVIGNVALTDRRVAFNQQINAITPFPGIDPEFLYPLLLFSKRRVQAASTKSMKGMVSKGALERVRVIWPPANVQREIAVLFRNVKRLAKQMEDAEPCPLLQALQSELLG